MYACQQLHHSQYCLQKFMKYQLHKNGTKRFTFQVHIKYVKESLNIPISNANFDGENSFKSYSHFFPNMCWIVPFKRLRLSIATYSTTILFWKKYSKIVYAIFHSSMWSRLKKILWKIGVVLFMGHLRRGKGTHGVVSFRISLRM